MHDDTAHSVHSVASAVTVSRLSPAVPASKEEELKKSHTRDPSLTPWFGTALLSTAFLPMQHLIKVKRVQAKKFTQGDLHKVALGTPQESALREAAKMNPSETPDGLVEVLP